MAGRRAFGTYSAIASAAACVIAIAGCGSSDDASKTPTAAAASSSAGAYPVSVRNCGRTLTFDKAPSRVVTAYEPTLKVLLDLGVTDKVIGQTPFEHEGEPPLPAGQIAEKKRIPPISKDISLPPKEKLLSLGPDLVYVVQGSEFDAKTGKATQTQLGKIGAQTFIGSAWCTPKDVPKATIAESYDDILDMGRIFGVSDRAEALVAREKASVADTVAKVGCLRVLPTVGSSIGL